MLAKIEFVSLSKTSVAHQFVCPNAANFDASQLKPQNFKQAKINEICIPKEPKTQDSNEYKESNLNKTGIINEGYTCYAVCLSHCIVYRMYTYIYTSECCTYW